MPEIFLTVLPIAAALLIGAATGILMTRRGFLQKADAPQTLRDEITHAIASAPADGSIEKEDRKRLLAALDLSERTVDEIMLHRSNIAMIAADLPPAQILDKVVAAPHTRLPLFRADDGHILGVVHAKDLLREVHRLARSAAREDKDSGGEEVLTSALDQLDIIKVAKDPYFIPETTTLDEQMHEFLRRHTHFALVVDEYGALQGLLTLEDILEEIVGDITDEFDINRKNPEIQPIEGGGWLIDGTMTIRDLNRAMDWNLPDDNANTIAGLIIHEAQVIPEQGQVFNFHGFRFQVETRRENRISRLKVLRAGDEKTSQPA